MNLGERNGGSTFGSSAAGAEETGRKEVKASAFQQEDSSRQMLSFSTSKEEPFVDSGDGSLPSFVLSSSRRLWDAEDLGYGLLSGAKRIFTPLQWMELQRQAMIFRYIAANAPIPSHLLASIGDANNNNNTAIYPGCSMGFLKRNNTFGWESLQMGSSSSKDIDPERCRRTDGKKWRCANNAAPNHKYCEKHMNRGRHRSRKPVEGRSGRSNMVPPIAHLPAMSEESGGGSNKSPDSEQQMQAWKPCAGNTVSKQLKRQKKENGSDWTVESLSGFSNPDPLSQRLTLCDIKKENLFKDSSLQMEMSTPSINHFISTQNLCLRNTPPINQAQKDQHLSSIDEESAHFTIPTISSDISSSSSSPTEEKEIPMALDEFGPIRMGVREKNKEQHNWMSSPAASYGGPLGEVVNKSHDSSNGSSPLNLLSDCWDSDSMARFVTNFASTDDLWLLT